MPPDLKGIYSLNALFSLCSEHILRIKGGDDASGSANTSVPMILVGNKADLADRRQVSQADAEARARSWGVKYIESSAKTRMNLEQVRNQSWAELHKKLVRPGPHQIFKISNVTAIFPGHVLCKIF